MNNSNLHLSTDNIGTDPSMLDIVERLDILPPMPNDNGKKNKSKKEKKAKKIGNKDNSKKPNILLIVIVIILMAGVGYGLYFYLHLGTKNNNNTLKENTGNVEEKVLENKFAFIGDILSTDLGYYGEFDSSCSIDLSTVDTSNAGTYEYYITCSNLKYKGSYIISEKEEIPLVNKLLYIQNVSELSVEKLVSVGSEYSAKFNDPDINNISVNDNELNTILIDIYKGDNLITTINGYFVKLNSNMYLKLTCVSDNEIIVLPFNDSKVLMDSAYIINNTIYGDNDFYSKVFENGMLFYDYNNKKIGSIEKNSIDSISNLIENSDLSYTNVSSYYRNNNYECSL